MKRQTIWVLLLVFLATGCGSRLPSPATAQRIVAKHFKKYGKKYKETDFGKYKVGKVEIAGVDELQKNLASVDAYTYLAGDGPVYRVRVTLQKKAFGWRYVRWESLGVR